MVAIALVCLVSVTITVVGYAVLEHVDCRKVRRSALQMQERIEQSKAQCALDLQRNAFDAIDGYLDKLEAVDEGNNIIEYCKYRTIFGSKQTIGKS